MYILRDTNTCVKCNYYYSFDTYVKQIILKNYYVIYKIIIFIRKKICNSLIFTPNFFKFLDSSSSHSFIVGIVTFLVYAKTFV